MKKVQNTALVVLLACAAFLLGGCGPEFENIEITQLTTPPITTTIDSYQVDMTSGVGVIVFVDPVSGNSEPYESDDNVTLESEDLGVMRVYQGEKFREFGVVGCTPGTTNLRVLINGHHEKTIPVTVRAQ